MFHTLRRVMLSMSGCLLLAASMAQVSLAMGTAFTYQGQLKGTDGVPLTTTCELTFALYDALSGGAQVGATMTKTGVTVTNGLFTTSVDFGSGAFEGSDRWLEITAKCGSDAAATTLSPRQALTPTPYALYAAGGVFENVSGVVRSTGTHATDDFVFGSPQLADVTTGTDDNVRLFFDKSKGAFRAGYVDGTQWDDASVGNYSFAAGSNTTASANYAAVAGGNNNTASANYAAVGGGYDNSVSRPYATVAGGNSNTASGEAATVGGGYDNSASHPYATVGGGKSNTTSGDFASYATVAGGDSNTASGHAAAVGGGYSNTASGDYAAVAGGYSNTAAGYYSFAAGYRAKIGDGHDGTFLFADSTEADFPSVAMNEFAVRARGGVRFADGGGTNKFTFNTATGVGTATTWTSTSDRNAKEHFAPVNPQEVLVKVAALPISTWNYKTQDASIRHLGPMAQDFRAAFGLGENDTTISTVDPDGVALAAIQGLYQLVQERDATIAALQAQQAAQQVTIDLLQQRLMALEQAVHTPVAQAGIRH